VALAREGKLLAGGPSSPRALAEARAGERGEPALTSLPEAADQGQQPRGFRQEAARVRALLQHTQAPNARELLSEIDRIVQLLVELEERQSDLEAQTSQAERDQLDADESSARAQLESTSGQDRELRERHLEAIAGRRRAIGQALAALERLRLRRSMAEHQLKQLRLDLSRAEVSSADVPDLSNRLQDIRIEVDAIEEVEDTLARGS